MSTLRCSTRQNKNRPVYRVSMSTTPSRVLYTPAIWPARHHSFSAFRPFQSIIPFSSTDPRIRELEKAPVPCPVRCCPGCLLLAALRYYKNGRPEKHSLQLENSGQNREKLKKGNSSVTRTQKSTKTHVRPGALWYLKSDVKTSTRGMRPGLAAQT